MPIMKLNFIVLQPKLEAIHELPQASACGQKKQKQTGFSQIMNNKK